MPTSIGNNSDSGVDTQSTDPMENIVLSIRIPDRNNQSLSYTTSADETVWSVKQKIIEKYGNGMKDVLNYGLYLPPFNGRAGKFLEEERPLKDYPMRAPVLVFQYKRRVLKIMNVSATKLKQVNSRSNLRVFLDAVRKGDCDKVRKLLNKGLDPNFYDKKHEDTPLSLAVSLADPDEMVKSLVGGGAHLDFRNPSGFTPLHRAVQRNNLAGVKILLSLGASANYKDAEGLTPLYHSIMCASDVSIIEALLYDHSIVNVTNKDGFTELHQSCKNDLAMHVEYLLFYGCDPNQPNHNGNTPLHICATENRSQCCQILLRRGARSNLVNSAGQTPVDVARLNHSFQVESQLRQHSADDVEEFKEMPRYNEQRRRTLPGSVGPMRRARSMDVGLDGQATLRGGVDGHSMVVLSENATVRSADGNPNATVRSLPSSNRTRRPTPADYQPTETVGDGVAGRRGVASRSPAVGRYQSPAEPGPAMFKPTSSRQFVCVRDYFPRQRGEIHLKKGEMMDVLGIGRGGLWEVKVAGVNRRGWVPSECIRQVEIYSTAVAEPAVSSPSTSSLLNGSVRSGGPADDNEKIILDRSVWEDLFPKAHSDAAEPATVPSPPSRLLSPSRQVPSTTTTSTTVAAATSNSSGSNGYVRMVMLRRGPAGFGFTIVGLKRESLSQYKSYHPGTQRFLQIDDGGAAQRAGIAEGDYLLEVNGQDVSKSDHRSVSELIRSCSADGLRLKVCTPKVETRTPGTASISRTRKPAPPPPVSPVERASIRDDEESSLWSVSRLNSQADRNSFVTAPSPPPPLSATATKVTSNSNTSNDGTLRPAANRPASYHQPPRAVEPQPDRPVRLLYEPDTSSSDSTPPVPVRRDSLAMSPMSPPPQPPPPPPPDFLTTDHFVDPFAGQGETGFSATASAISPSSTSSSSRGMSEFQQLLNNQRNWIETSAAAAAVTTSTTTTSTRARLSDFVQPTVETRVHLSSGSNASSSSSPQRTHNWELAAAVARRKQSVETGQASDPSAGLWNNIDRKVSVYRSQQSPSVLPGQSPVVLPSTSSRSTAGAAKQTYPSSPIQKETSASSNVVFRSRHLGAKDSTANTSYSNMAESLRQQYLARIANAAKH